MKYIQEFETVADYNDARQNDYIEHWTSLTDSTGDINYDKSGRERLSMLPLTFDILSSGNIVYKSIGSPTNTAINYKKNNGEWTTINSSSNGTIIPVVFGDVVAFESENTPGESNSNYNCFSDSTCTFNLYGNIKSLSNWQEISSSSTYAFYKLFADCTGLINANDLILPYNTLPEYGYGYMFYNCTGLQNAPELPATSPGSGGANYHYAHMFENCTSLIQTPMMKITSAGYGTCYAMFKGCTNLVTVTEFEIITINYMACSDMFSGCSNLINMPPLKATKVSSAENGQYNRMFKNCSKLNNITCLLNKGNSNVCSNWLSGVSQTGTFTKASNSTWDSGVSGIPSGWTIQDYQE